MSGGSTLTLRLTQALSQPCGLGYFPKPTNVTLKEFFAILQELTGVRAPRWRVPYWLAISAGYLDHMVEDKILGREPRIPLEGLKVSKKPMYVSCQKAVRELGQLQNPVEAAVEKAVKWFSDHRYTPARAER